MLPPTFHDWSGIADNIESLKIKAVLCTGDLVEQNDNNVLNRKMLNTALILSDSILSAIHAVQRSKSGWLISYLVYPCGSPSKIIEKDSGLTNFWGSARCCAGRQVTEAHNIPANK